MNQQTIDIATAVTIGSIPVLAGIVWLAKKIEAKWPNTTEAKIAHGVEVAGELLSTGIQQIAPLVLHVHINGTSVTQDSPTPATTTTTATPAAAEKAS